MIDENLHTEPVSGEQDLSDPGSTRTRDSISKSSKNEQRYQRKRRRRRKLRRRRLRTTAVLPSLFTLGNLIAGFAAIYFAAKPIENATTFNESPSEHTTISSLTIAGTLIFIGMFFDAVDGYVARLTRSTSELGGQLDSLADIVTFGVAPAYMTLQLVSKYYLSGDVPAQIFNPLEDNFFIRIFWVSSAIYVSCAALRLARFNVETVSGVLDNHLFFRGLPTPGAAGCIASLIILHQHRLANSDYEWAAYITGLGMTFILLLCAIAMVSRLPYTHFVNRYLKRHVSFRYVVILAIILVFAAFYRKEALAIGFTVYALSAPCRALFLRWRHKKRNVNIPQ